MLLDTNILIYLAQPGGETLQAQIASTSPAASLISRVEALGFQRITDDERERLDTVFAWWRCFPWMTPWQTPPSCYGNRGA